MLKKAFNLMTKIHSRPATLKRFGTPDITSDIRVTPSNYFRFLEGPSHTVVRGREFIIPSDTITDPFTPVIKRGDKIIHDLFGSLAIDEIVEICDIGGAVMGYRVRCE